MLKEDKFEIEDNTESGEITDWENPPSVLDLKNDYTSAKVIQDSQVIKINK